MDESYVQTVEAIAQQLMNRGYNVYRKSAMRCFIEPEKTTHPDTRTFAGERAALHVLRLMGLDTILLDLGLTDTQAKLTCALVIGRMLSPGSEANTLQWMTKTSSILDLLDLEAPSANTLYRVSDHLYKHCNDLVDRLYQNTQDAIDFDESIVFYDLTNIHYHGREKGEFLRHGRSKQKRSDCRLVTLALTLSASGFPRCVQILPGNISEPSTLKDGLDQLRGEHPTVIMDAGIATKKNLAYLHKEGFDHIVIDRSKTPSVPDQTPEIRFETENNVQIRAWRLIDQALEEGKNASRNGQECTQSTDEASTPESVQPSDPTLEKDPTSPMEQRIYVHSEAKQWTQDQIRNKKCNQYEEELCYLHEGLSIRGRLKKLDKVYQKMGRLKEKYKLVSHLYDVIVVEKEGSKNAQALRVVKNGSYEDQIQASGGYVIRTSHVDWKPERVIRTYHRLTEIESAFRVMKSELGIRPLHHSRDDRIVAHMIISILAYHATHLVRNRLKGIEVHDSWETIRDHLNAVRRIKTRLVKNKYRYLIMEVDQDIPLYLV